MRSKIIKTITAIAISAIIAFLPLSAFADQCSPNVCSGSYPESVKAACGCNGNSGADLPNAIQTILNNIILVAGTIAVVFIVVGGVYYITSSGDANKVKKAKDTILYACIGLIICALAFAIVNFTIGLIGKGGNNSDKDTDNSEEESLIITEKDIAFLEKKL